MAKCGSGSPGLRYAPSGLRENPMRRLHWLVLCLLVMLCSASAQTWPTPPVTLVVPFPPGPALDLVTRLVGVKLGEALGQNIVVENRTGANGMIGAKIGRASC